MKHIFTRLALLALPLVAYLCFFVAFEPNNYFGLRANTNSKAPISRLQSFRREPGESVIIGDSRFAHFDAQQVAQVSGRDWQNLAFGGASLRESLDLLEWVLNSDTPPKEVLFGLSFYTINASYDTDRMSNLELTLSNPFAYVMNLEYNINTLTHFQQVITGQTDSPETGDWVWPEDYTGADGTVYPVHTLLAEYPQALVSRCRNWSIQQDLLNRLYQLAEQCQQQGVSLTVVLAPMSDHIRTEICQVYGTPSIQQQMENTVLPQLNQQADVLGFAVLDYEWENPPQLDQDTQFFDGFHLDERYGLPVWVEQLFQDLNQHWMAQ